MTMANYKALKASAEEIASELQMYSRQGIKMFATSSFQTQSLPLLHLISESKLDIPIYFTNTGFVHADTIKFAEAVSSSLKLRLVHLYPTISKINQLNSEGRFFYTSDPDFCCHLNKVLPLEPILHEYDAWINGVRADQSSARAKLEKKQTSKHGCVRYHPMLHWNSKMIYDYRQLYSLPEHPLEAKGYLTVGCQPCTSKYTPGDNERNARWFGMNKSECGLNTILASDHKD